jgi:hypothetical protein
MNTITRAAAATLMLSLAACGQAETGKTGAAAEASSAAGVVSFTAQPDLAEDVAALPRIVGEGAAIERVNADLQRIDGAVMQNACEGGGGIERGVTQPMTGPAYVSFWIAEGYYCEGAAHPSNDQTAVTYDLATGARVNWIEAAPGLQLTAGDLTDMAATYVPRLSSPAISTFYSRRMLTDPVEGPDAEWLEQCRDVFAPDALTDTTFKLWLDAENGGVSLSPDFPHVIQGCASTVTMTAAEMREFGVSAAMIQAVTAAHATGNWAPKES